MAARPAYTYRAARRNRAREMKLLWREMPRREQRNPGYNRISTTIIVPVPLRRKAAR